MKKCMCSTGRQGRKGQQSSKELSGLTWLVRLTHEEMHLLNRDTGEGGAAVLLGVIRVIMVS